MKIWTYGQMRNKVEMDLDLQDETFIKPNEMIGYFNESLNEAESEIHLLAQDYFLTKAYLPVVQGVNQYPLPYNIYANKIRAVIYQNGSQDYAISQIRTYNKMELITMINQYGGAADWYRYYLMNDTIGQSQIVFTPNMRDTAIIAPVSQQFSPITMWYLRGCARVPLLGDYCNPEITAPTQVNVAADQIQTYAGTGTVGKIQVGLPGAYPGSLAYKTGDQVQFQIGPGGTLPAPLVAGTTYFVIASGAGLIKLATSLVNALAGTAIDLTTTGTVYFTMTVAATQTIVDATLIDIPEFATFVMQWVKCRCMEKEGDPRIEMASNVLVQQKKQMVDTLTQMIPDNDDTIQADLSHYYEMN